MKLRIALLAACLAMLISGCGGGRGTNLVGDLTVPDQFMNNLSGAITTRDRDFIGSNISFNYYDNCQDYSGLLNEMMQVLGTSGPIDFTFDAPSDKVVNDQMGTATFTESFTLTVDSRTMTRSGTFHLKAENGHWHLYGDQDCHP